MSVDPGLAKEETWMVGVLFSLWFAKLLHRLSVSSSFAALLPEAQCSGEGECVVPLDPPQGPSLEVAAVAASAPLTLGQEGGRGPWAFKRGPGL